MSKTFKITLATISLIISIQVFGFLIFDGLFHDTWYNGRIASSLNLFAVVGIIGILTVLLSYIKLHKTNKDIYFWLSIIPIILVFILRSMSILRF